MRDLKREKGFTGEDIAISIAIIMFFTGFIVTLSYNIYLTTASVKMISTANSYIIDIFEAAEIWRLR